MPTNYDDIAEQYGRSKHVPWREHIERYSLLELLGDISGAAVLDLACGNGHYARILKKLGAMRVVGVGCGALPVRERVGPGLALRVRARAEFAG